MAPCLVGLLIGCTGIGAGEPICFRKAPNSPDYLLILSSWVASVPVSRVGFWTECFPKYAVVYPEHNPFSWVRRDEPFSLISGASRCLRNGCPRVDVGRTRYCNLWCWKCRRICRELRPNKMHSWRRSWLMARWDARIVPSAVCRKSAVCRNLPCKGSELVPTGGTVITAGWQNTPIVK